MVEKVWDNPAVFRIPVGLPENPLRNLNVYVVRGATRELVIDTGFNRPECRADLWRGIGELGLDLSRTALFLTHLHADHTGLVWDFVERGVPVYMGRVERDYCAAYGAGTAMVLAPVFSAEGYPREQIPLQATENQAVRYIAKQGYPVTPLEDGEELSLGDVRLTAIHTPGHTPGHMALYLPAAQLLFAGDHILFDITPNISVWPGIPHSLADYLGSLQRIRALPIRAALPAHRGMGTDVCGRIGGLAEHHARRLDELCRAVSASPGLTAYEAAGQIRWSARGLPWAAFPPHQRWFAMGETVAHLYELVRRGRVVRRSGDVARYFPSAG